MATDKERQMLFKNKGKDSDVSSCVYFACLHFISLVLSNHLLPCGIEFPAKLSTYVDKME